MYTENDIPKYKKRKHSSTSKAKDKSNHKHEYIECLFIENNKPYRGVYCSVCGKIGDIWFAETEPDDIGHRLLTNEEVLEKYNHLQQIPVDTIWQKYVILTTE